jgi:hypothetical protein
MKVNYNTIKREIPIIKFGSHLFTWKLNRLKANYKSYHEQGESKGTHTSKPQKEGNLYYLNNKR